MTHPHTPPSVPSHMGGDVRPGTEFLPGARPVPSPRLTKQQQRSVSRVSAVLAFIRAHATGDGMALCSDIAIAEGVGFDRSTVRKAITTLEIRGDLTRTGKGAYRIGRATDEARTVTRFVPNTSSLNSGGAMLVPVSLPRLRFLEGT